MERFCSYISMVTSVSELEHSTFEEALDHQVWYNSKVEEYSSIMKNNVCEVVQRLEGKYVVTSRWLD